MGQAALAHKGPNIITRKKITVAEFWDYLERIVWEVEIGRLKATDMPARLVQDYGGTTVCGYVPMTPPEQRQKIKALIQTGVPARTARAKVRGR
jgi:hypothetical protein